MNKAPNPDGATSRIIQESTALTPPLPRENVNDGEVLSSSSALPEYQDPLSEDAMDDVLIAVDDMLPSRSEQLRQVSSPQAPQYIKQLVIIQCSLDVRLAALSHYLSAEKSRQHWAQYDISEKKIGLYQKRLLEAYAEAKDCVSPNDGATPEEEEKMGKNIFHETLKRVKSVKLNGHVMASEISEGELHHFANGECRIYGTKETRCIGWHPHWENFL